MTDAARATSSEASSDTVTWPTAQEIGILQWFEYENYEAVESALADLKALGVSELRTGFSWADWHRPNARAWFDWFIPRLAEDVDLLPCFLYTPPSIGIAPKTASPPRDLAEYTEFLELAIDLYGDAFEYVELWNEPNNLSEWDWQLDRGWQMFAEMVGTAAEAAHRLGKKTVLGGMAPVDTDWLALMFRYGALDHMDVVGVHGFSNVCGGIWRGWPAYVRAVQEVLDEHASPAEIWITETGFSTWRHQEMGQLQAFIEAAGSPVPRVYWYGLYDLEPERSTVDGFHLDEREYHFGLREASGRPKLLYRLWSEEGLEGVHDMRAVSALGGRPRTDEEKPVLITGGAGFIGTNLAHRLLSGGRPVTIFDNLSRPGVEHNLRWLVEQHSNAVDIHIADIRDPHVVHNVVQDVGAVVHLAAQVAVTTSFSAPMADFDVNAQGTLHLLEALRGLETPPPLIYTSTNKVYGALTDLALERGRTRYRPLADDVASDGISEDRSLDFHSPYGCSKGAADQYVRDYARSFGLPTVVFRMSCIYGPHQYGTEDQGWIAHFLLRALAGEGIVIYGDGRQVRDILFVDDLVDAFLLTLDSIDELAGEVFNIGGGPDNTISLVELLSLIEEMDGQRPDVSFHPWRAGDQRYYVSDISRFHEATGWWPDVDVTAGVRRLYGWLDHHRGPGSHLGAVSMTSLTTGSD